MQLCLTCRYSMMMTPHPLRNDGFFNIGTFATNADGGLALTTVPERWRARWVDSVNAAQLADRAGLDFILPIARWRGFGGQTHARESSFETFSWASGLAMATSRVAIFATVHVPVIHPLYAAKALATLDHISNGRAALNIVCGWNPDEFAMFGIELEGDPYAQAAEWLEVIETVYGSERPSDYAGDYYRLKSAVSRPASLQTPRPFTMNAAVSETGRRFALGHCDSLFTTFKDFADLESHIHDAGAMSAEVGRSVPIYTVAHVVCRETKSEADAYYRRFSIDYIDTAAADNHMRQKQTFATTDGYEQYRQRFAAGGGTYPLVGTPAGIAEELIAIAQAGCSGIALSFVNYTHELPFFCDRVLPLLKAAGFRG